jgi:two-component system, cell cycle response regulator DivK
VITAAPRVLVVDDNALTIELVGFVLGQAGFDLQTAGDAAAALQRIAERRPDLILMDIQLPGLDGLALTRRLKADAATRDIVIIAFTAYAMKGDELTMRAAGCDGYLSKPIDVARLADTLRGWLPRQEEHPD